MMSFAREAEAKEQHEAHRTALAALIDSLRKAK
jgi:hypothetical protein